MATTTPNFSSISPPSGSTFEATKCYGLVPGSSTQTTVVPCGSAGAMKGADLNAARSGLANKATPGVIASAAGNAAAGAVSGAVSSIGNAVADVFNQAVRDLKYGAVLIGVMAMALLMVFVGLKPSGAS